MYSSVYVVVVVVVVVVVAERYMYQKIGTPWTRMLRSTLTESSEAVPIDIRGCEKSWYIHETGLYSAKQLHYLFALTQVNILRKPYLYINGYMILGPCRWIPGRVLGAKFFSRQRRLSRLSPKLHPARFLYRGSWWKCQCAQFLPDPRASLQRG